MERKRYTPARLEELAAAAVDAAVTDLKEHYREVKIECRHGGALRKLPCSTKERNVCV